MLYYRRPFGNPERSLNEGQRDQKSDYFVSHSPHNCYFWFFRLGLNLGSGFSDK